MDSGEEGRRGRTTERFTDTARKSGVASLDTPRTTSGSPSIGREMFIASSTAERISSHRRRRLLVPSPLFFLRLFFFTGMREVASPVSFVISKSGRALNGLQGGLAGARGSLKMNESVRWIYVILWNSLPLKDLYRGALRSSRRNIISGKCPGNLRDTVEDRRPGRR